MDVRQFEDFLKANNDDLGSDLVQESEDFAKRLQVANRLYKSHFGDSGTDQRNPGEMQGTLLLCKMQQEVMSRQEQRQKSKGDD